MDERKLERNLKKEKGKEREIYYDFLKFFAIFIIFLTHFIDTFDRSLFDLWEKLPTSIFLFGVSGKLGVSIFGVIMCVLAYDAKETNTLVYFLKRYLYFAAGGAIINILYVLYGYSSLRVDAWEFLKLTFLLSDKFFPTFWCIPDFLIASCIAFLNGKYRVKVKGVLFEIFLLWLCHQHWAAICLMGCIVKLLLKEKKCRDFFSKRLVRVVGCVLIFFAIKRDEGFLTYYIDGFCAMLFLVIMHCSERLKRFLSMPRILAWIGRYTMPIFLIHSFIFQLIKEKLSPAVGGRGQLAVLFLFCLAAVVAATLILEVVLRYIKRLTDLLVETLIRSKQQGALGI